MLFILAFDHRNSFRTGFLGIDGEPTADDHARAREAKLVILDGLLRAVASGLPAGRPGILVDDEYGADATARARAEHILVAVPVEQSGRRELEFEHDPFFATVKALEPDYVKVLVRYNPEGDQAMNHRQVEKLERVQEWTASNSTGFMLELLVPPEPEQARAAYDTELRPTLTLQAVKNLTRSGVRPDLWKLEGMGSRSEYEAIAKVATAARHESRCLVLGRGEDETAVERWLRLAAPVPGFAGFAVGRTIWWKPLRAYYDGRVSRGDAVQAIGDNYRRMVDAYVDGSRGAPQA